MDLRNKREIAFTVPISDKESINVNVQVPAIRSQGLNLLPWASTYVLAGLLHKLDIHPPPARDPRIPILELGAGIGLVGLVGSMLWHQRVVLTDLDTIVPGLLANIDANSALLKQHKGSAAAGALDWEKPDTLILSDHTVIKADEAKANIILAADTIYDEEHPQMVAQTVARWLAPGPDSRVVLTYPLRVAYLDQIRELWERLEGCGLESMAEGKEEAGEHGEASWDDERLCEWSVWRWKEGGEGSA